MPKRSAGILLYRHAAAELEVFLVHPGGPFWAKRDAGAWSIPKGEYQSGEDHTGSGQARVRRGDGVRLEGQFVALGSFRQSRAKTVDVWALAGDVDPAKLRATRSHGMAAEVGADAGVP